MEREREMKLVVGTAGDGRFVAFGSGRWDIARSPVRKNLEKEAFIMKHESLISCLYHLDFLYSMSSLNY
jgi:hypothetical protein